MTRLPEGLPLVGQIDPFAHLGQKFRNTYGPTASNENVVILVAILATFVVVVLLAARFLAPARKKARNSPWLLFYHLCRAHHLRLGDALLLYRLARHHRGQQPALVFLNAELLQSCEAEGQFAKGAARIARIRSIIFGEESLGLDDARR